MNALLAHRTEQKPPETAQTARADHQRIGVRGHLDENAGSWPFHNERLNLSGWVSTPDLPDRLLEHAFSSALSLGLGAGRQHPVLARITE
jgi:hypothetical protein